jgi:hypothetical protein
MPAATTYDVASPAGHENASAKARPIVLAVFLVVVGLVSVRTATKIDTAAALTGRPSPAQWGLADFRDNFYYPVVALLEGQNPYDRAAYMQRYPVVNGFPLYLPLTLLLYLPFGLLPLEISQWLHHAVTVGLTLVLAAVTLRLCAITPSWPRVLGVATLALVSRPGHWNLALGNCAVPAALGIYLAFLHARRRPWLAAIALALSTFKPTFGLPAALLLAAGGLPGLSLRALSISAVLSASVVAVLSMSAGGLAPFIASLQANYIGWQRVAVVDAGTAPFRVDIVALVGRLTGHPPTAGEALMLTAAVLVIGALVVRRAAALSTDGVTGPLPASIVCVSILLCTYHQAYDLILLLLPLTALIGRALPLACEPRRLVRGALLMVLALPGANYLASGTAMATLGVSGELRLLVTSLNGLALIAALLLYTRLSADPSPPHAFNAAAPVHR